MKTIRQQLLDLGLRPGDVVLMHSSMSALKTTLTPEEFLQEIMAVLGDEGTLLLPGLSYDVVSYLTPYFSVNQTPPTVGLLPRTFWRMDDVVRSIHPTHSVLAWGKLAQEITKDHLKDTTPVGPNSPIMKLPEQQGKILFIGDILHTATFMHGVEEEAKVPYGMAAQPIDYEITPPDGNTFMRQWYPRDFSDWKQEYQRMTEILSAPDIQNGPVGKANSYLVDAAALREHSLTALQDDPYFFVTPRTAEEKEEYQRKAQEEQQRID